MTDSAPDQNQDLILKLDAEHRRDIDTVRTSMEKFLRGQLELEHKMEIVAKGQDQLKERFEIGTARTLKELKDSFDEFRVEWGQKKAEDIHRDERITGAEQSASKANEKYDGINKGLLWVVLAGTLLFLMKLLMTWKP